MTTTVRVSDATHSRLVAIAARTGKRMQAVLEEALAKYETDEFWGEFTERWAQLRDDDDGGWTVIAAERAGEAPALSDDLDT